MRLFRHTLDTCFYYRNVIIVKTGPFKFFSFLRFHENLASTCFYLWTQFLRSNQVNFRGLQIFDQPYHKHAFAIHLHRLLKMWHENNGRSFSSSRVQSMRLWRNHVGFNHWLDWVHRRTKNPRRKDRTTKGRCQKGWVCILHVQIPPPPRGGAAIFLDQNWVYLRKNERNFGFCQNINFELEKLKNEPFQTRRGDAFGRQINFSTIWIKWFGKSDLRPQWQVHLMTVNMGITRVWLGYRSCNQNSTYNTEFQP